MAATVLISLAACGDDDATTTSSKNIENTVESVAEDIGDTIESVVDG